jgi:iron(III) transport system permease protein
LRGRYPSEAAGRNVLDEPPGIAVAVSAVLISFAISIIVAAVPIVGLIRNLGRSVMRGDAGELTATWSMGSVADRVAEAPRVFASEYFWTAIIAAVTSMVAVAIAWPIASRIRYRSAGPGRFAGQAVLDAITIAMICMPGPIVGLAVVSLFQWGVPGFAFLYQQTIVPTVIAMLVRGFPISYWIIRGGYAGIRDETLEMARLDASPLVRFWQIERPLVLRSLIGAGLATAIVTSGDLPAALPVVPAGVTTVAIRLFGLLHSGVRYQESALVAWYVLAVIAGFWLFRLVYNPGRK